MLPNVAASDVHDERLWLKIVETSGALGNTSCHVGTPEWMTDTMLRYYQLGVPARGRSSDAASVLIWGFNPFNDAVDIGR